MPSIPGLTSAEEKLLLEVWKEVRSERLPVEESRQNARQQYGETLLKKLYAKREKSGKTLPRTLCSGACKEAWPRSKFSSLQTGEARMGLSNRCKYCSYLSQADKKQSGQGRKNAKQGRRLSHDEFLRLRDIVGEYSEIVPAILLRQLILYWRRHTQPSAQRAKVKMTMQKSKEISWRWYFLRAMPTLPKLSDEEIAKLYLLSPKAQRAH